jgi:hypothetical protein
MLAEAVAEARDDAVGETGALLGKRYFDEESSLELICVKPGAGVLTVAGRELRLRGTKALPSSD